MLIYVENLNGIKNFLGFDAINDKMFFCTVDINMGDYFLKIMKDDNGGGEVKEIIRKGEIKKVYSKKRNIIRSTVIDRRHMIDLKTWTVI